jgi:hypothetical protein
MIVCDSFAFLHLHKSGGTFVGRMMMTCIPSARRVGYHLPYAEIPEACRGLPVLGSVRNPWSYYVSWYHFQKAQERPNPLFWVCSHEGRDGFEATIARLVTLESRADDVERLAAAFPESYVNYGLNLTRGCIRTIQGAGKGFYTFLHDRLYAGAVAPRILKMEALREELLDLPAGLGVHEARRARQFIAGTPNLNVSEHGPYRDYYSAELKALVAEMDRPVIDAYGYTF